MRAIDVRHKGVEKVICCFEVDGVHGRFGHGPILANPCGGRVTAR